MLFYLNLAFKTCFLIIGIDEYSYKYIVYHYRSIHSKMEVVASSQCNDRHLVIPYSNTLLIIRKTIFFEDTGKPKMNNANNKIHFLI